MVSWLVVSVHFPLPLALAEIPSLEMRRERRELQGKQLFHSFHQKPDILGKRVVAVDVHVAVALRSPASPYDTRQRHHHKIGFAQPLDVDPTSSVRLS